MPWFAILLCAGLAWMAPARAQAPAAPLPSFAELEAAGARVGEIRVVPGDIFDLGNPNEDKALFRAANRLHIITRPGVIERAVLFKSGEPVSARLIEETERLLRANRYLYEVAIRPVAVHDGVVDIEVVTRDTWSLDPGLSAGRTGGATTGGFRIRDYNIFGTGTSIGVGRSKDVDRTSTEFEFSNTRAFGTWASFDYQHATSSDGSRDAISLLRPFYELDARWSAGASAMKDERIDSVYNAGNVVAQYRRSERRAEVFGGLSPGLQDGWVQRYSLGLNLQEDGYANDPTLVAPSATLPASEKLVGPFVRYELVEDRFEREVNRNLIGRPEFFALGLAAKVQIGRASTGLGSTRSPWLYAGTIGRGFEPWPDHRLMAQAQISGQVDDGQVRRQRIGAQAQYYLPQSRHRLFYASASADHLTRPELPDTLMLGADNGLRGYPLRYQSGTRRALFTVEERFYTDLYVWQLFRVGGALFFDVGRAWGGDNVNALNPGWLRNVGAGLRIVSVRSAFSNVLHVDLAFPIDASADIKKVQLNVKTKTSF
jgi:outer membrane protein assembly factor BamA